MAEALPPNKRCKHGCPFSTTKSCKNKEDGTCACDQCDGNCVNEPCDTCTENGVCVYEGCPCCTYIHLGVVLFGNTDDRRKFDEKRGDCGHCNDIRDEKKHKNSDAEHVPCCEFHDQLTRYNAELARAAALAGASGKRASTAAGGAADESKRTRHEEQGAAGGSSQVIDISSDGSSDEREVVNLISDDEGPSGSAAPVRRVARESSDPPAVNRGEAHAAGARAAEARAAGAAEAARAAGAADATRAEEAADAAEAGGEPPPAPRRRFNLRIKRN